MTPELKEALSTLTDCQLIHVVSEIMSYGYPETYKLAHELAHVEGDPWEKWSHNFSLVTDGGGKLPIPVRNELEEAMEKFRTEDRIKPGYFKSIHRANSKSSISNTMFGSSNSTILKWMGWMFLIWWILGLVQSCGAGS
jgi:hypothetical protein